MPTYDFACRGCNEENTQAFGFYENHVVICPKCENPMTKVISATPAVFRGSGWGGK
jgi:putative FmdB family regulatory protein